MRSIVQLFFVSVYTCAEPSNIGGSYYSVAMPTVVLKLMLCYAPCGTPKSFLITLDVTTDKIQLSLLVNAP